MGRREIYRESSRDNKIIWSDVSCSWPSEQIFNLGSVTTCQNTDRGRELKPQCLFRRSLLNLFCSSLSLHLRRTQSQTLVRQTVSRAVARLIFSLFMILHPLVLWPPINLLSTPVRQLSHHVDEKLQSPLWSDKQSPSPRPGTQSVSDFIRNLFMFRLGVVTHRSAISVPGPGGYFGEFPGHFVSCRVTNGNVGCHR